MVEGFFLFTVPVFPPYVHRVLFEAAPTLVPVSILNLALPFERTVLQLLTSLGVALPWERRVLGAPCFGSGLSWGGWPALVMPLRGSVVPGKAASRWQCRVPLE